MYRLRGEGLSRYLHCIVLCCVNCVYINDTCSNLLFCNFVLIVETEILKFSIFDLSKLATQQSSKRAADYRDETDSTDSRLGGIKETLRFVRISICD